MRRERDELEDAVDVDLAEPRLEQPLGGPAADEPCAHGQALIPVASTPTAGARAASEAAAIPISETISCVGIPVTGVSRCSG